MWALPAVVTLAWFGYVVGGGQRDRVAMHWRSSITMTFGGFVAGSTPRAEGPWHFRCSPRSSTCQRMWLARSRSQSRLWEWSSPRRSSSWRPLEVLSTAIFPEDLRTDRAPLSFALGGLVLAVGAVWFLNRHRHRVLGLDPAQA